MSGDLPLAAQQPLTSVQKFVRKVSSADARQSPSQLLDEEPLCPDEEPPCPGEEPPSDPHPTSVAAATMRATLATIR